MQFDTQAKIYDERTGLGEQTAKKVAEAITQYIPSHSQGHLLEIGAGTGEIGYFLQQLPIPYLGFDLSKGMLDQYIQRSSNPLLIQCDGNQTWPFQKHSISIFFSSRAIHQLHHDHVLAQLKYLANQRSSLFILGYVKRQKDSVKATMRREMHKLLNQHGLKEKSGQSSRNELFLKIEQAGGKALPTMTVSQWQVNHAPIDSINSWLKVDGIAGRDVDKDLKKDILGQLKKSVASQYCDLEKSYPAQESYQLSIIQLPKYANSD